MLSWSRISAIGFGSEIKILYRKSDEQNKYTHGPDTERQVTG